jgi:hypothetical protein
MDPWTLKIFFILFEKLGSKTSDNIYNKTTQLGAWCMNAFHSIQSAEYSKTITYEREYEYVCLLLLLARIRYNNTFIEEERSVVGIYDSINANKSKRMKECLGSNCQWILWLFSCVYIRENPSATWKLICPIWNHARMWQTDRQIDRQTEWLSSVFCCRSIQHHTDCLWTSGNTSWMVYGIRTLDHSLRVTEDSKCLKATNNLIGGKVQIQNYLTITSSLHVLTL